MMRDGPLEISSYGYSSRLRTRRIPARWNVRRRRTVCAIYGRLQPVDGRRELTRRGGSTSGVLHCVEEVLRVKRKYVCRLQHFASIFEIQSRGAVLLRDTHGVDQLGHVGTQQSVSHLNLSQNVNVQQLSTNPC